MTGKLRIPVLLSLAALVALSSCAIHATFPFICFRSGCVHQQFNLRGFKKRLKGSLFALKKKRGKKSKPPAEKKKNAAVSEKAGPDLSLGRSHFYIPVKFVVQMDSSAPCGYAMDSTMTGVRDGKKITGTYNAEATAFLQNLDKKYIRTVIVTLWDDEAAQRYRNTHASRVRYLVHYLAARGIARSKIMITDTARIKHVTGPSVPLPNPEN